MKVGDRIEVVDGRYKGECGKVEYVRDNNVDVRLDSGAYVSPWSEELVVLDVVTHEGELTWTSWFEDPVVNGVSILPLFNKYKAGDHVRITIERRKG